jgi:transcriptional regulator with XRE-family HTH domain
MPRTKRAIQSNLAGTMIRSRRLALEMTQSDVAEKLGVSQPLISQIEHGVAPPTIDQCEKLADLLDLDFSMIMFNRAKDRVINGRDH